MNYYVVYQFDSTVKEGVGSYVFTGCKNSPPTADDIQKWHEALQKELQCEVVIINFILLS